MGNLPDSESKRGVRRSAYYVMSDIINSIFTRELEEENIRPPQQLDPNHPQTILETTKE